MIYFSLEVCSPSSFKWHLLEYDLKGEQGVTRAVCEFVPSVHLGRCDCSTLQT